MKQSFNLPELRCTRCNHTWIPRKPGMPKQCPKCHSPYWNESKRKGLQKEKSKEGTVKYWVNVHHPRGLTESHSDQCRVYVQEKSDKNNLPFCGDRVFIYETGALSGETRTLIDENGKHLVKLGKGKKGIIALVEIASELKEHRHEWNGTKYYGSYGTKEIPTEKEIVRLDEINAKFSDLGISKTFNPRSYTGIISLKSDSKIRALLELMGV